MIRTSQAFAAFRQSIIEQLHAEIENSLVPQFNSEVVDIEKDYTSTVAASEETPTPNAKLALVRVAERNREARVLDLKLRRQHFLNEVQSKLRLEMHQRIDEYKGVVSEETEERDGRKRLVEKVKFPDGSIAKVPAHVYVDFKQFESV